MYIVLECSSALWLVIVYLIARDPIQKYSVVCDLNFDSVIVLWTYYIIKLTYIKYKHLIWINMFRCTNTKNDILDWTDVGLKSVLLTFKVHMDEHFFIHFLLRMIWNNCHCFSTLLYNTPLGRARKIMMDWNWTHHLMFTGMTRLYWTKTWTS